MEQKWYVMRVYQNERKAEEILKNETYGLEHFIPKEDVIRTRHGKKIVCREPVIRSLIFVHSTYEAIIHFKQNYYNNLQFVVCRRDDLRHYLTVSDKEMYNFMLVYEQKDRQVTFYRPDDEDFENALKKGDRIRIHGGRLDTLEGYVTKVKGKRSKQIVVVVPDALAISTAQVDDGIIEIVKKADDEESLKR